MLPPLTYSGRNVTISGVLEPAYDIAGDTFDYALNGDTTHLAIIDAIGHGLEASRIANLAVAAYRNGRRWGLDPTGIYRTMDAAISEQFGDEKFATAQLATLALSTGRLRWLNAGHPPPMVLRRLERIDLPSEPCLPVGLALDEDPTVNEVELAPGDLVLFFTDGVIEARSADGEEFGRDRLGELLAQAAAAEQTPAETVRRLGHAVLTHQEGVLEDDGTLLLLVWHGPASPYPFPAGASIT
jgi:serine phosphatase RsbU (regulator of sigma subunit)